MHGHQKPVQAGGHKQQLPKGTGASVRPGECGGAGTGRGSPGTAPGATQRPGGWRGRQQPVGTQSTAQPARTELLAQASREGVPEGCWSLREVTIKKGLDWNPQVLATHLSLCSHHEEPCDREHRVGGRGNRQTDRSVPSPRCWEPVQEWLPTDRTPPCPAAQEPLQPQPTFWRACQ